MSSSTVLCAAIVLFIIAIINEKRCIGSNSYLYSKGRACKTEDTNTILSRIWWLAKNRHSFLPGRLYIISFCTTALIYFTNRNFSADQFVKCLLVVIFISYTLGNYFDHHSNSFYNYYIMKNISYIISPEKLKRKLKVNSNNPSYNKINFFNSVNLR